MTLLSHNQYKYILRLIKNSHFRRSENAVFVEGDNIVNEIYKNKKELIKLILVTDKTKDKYKQNQSYYVNQDGVKRLSSRVSGFDTAAVLDLHKIKDTEPKSLKGLNIGLVEIQDPGNMGTIFRTAEAFGINSIVLFSGCVDPLNQKSIDASVGSVFRVPFYKIDSLQMLKDLNENLQIVGTASQANKSYKDIAIKENSIIIFGNEGRGLDKNFLNNVDETIKIPLKNIDSLNVAVSLGIICSHFSK